MNNLKEEELLTIYTIGHDPNVTFVNKNNEIITLELDRWVNTKYNRTSTVVYSDELLYSEYL